VDANQIARAQLAYDKQVQTVKELGQQAKELGSDNAKAQAAGIPGTQAYTSALAQVKSAQQSVADASQASAQADLAASRARSDGAASIAKAQQSAADSIASADAQVVNAREALGKAEANVDKARVAGAQAVADAQEQGARSIQSADQSVIDAQRALQQAMKSTADSGKGAADKVAQAFANLSPAAADFAKYLFSLKPALDQLKASAATGLFPPIQAGIAAMMTQLPNLIMIVGQFGAAMGGAIGYVLQQLASPLWMGFFSTLASVSGPILLGLAQMFMKIAASVMNLIMALLPFTPAAMQIVGIIGDLINAWAPFIAQMVGALLPVAGQVLNAFKPLGPVFAALGPILAVLGTGVRHRPDGAATGTRARS
jgi:phage-related protein